ncbi:hypothetical protein J4399_04875 [Candidatus Woesearchaeota archaeon]|nr:hypothetical protein [Candidatus Woesearchaeota archaeon]HIJ01619.1 hypothetical protein [Candidatus Woesearchaeota archaeon]HIJ14245.1 hypothetical protein [Candidatus Woesearchaeota archaeon]
MPKNLTLEETYDKCTAEGNIILQDKIDINKIKSMLAIIEEYITLSEEIKKHTSYNAIYDIHYNILHLLTEALLRFDKVKSANHQCLFTYLCVKHPELDLDWNFFEKIRTKRNGINYYGVPVNRQDWKTIELQASIYIKTLHRKLKEKITEEK